MAIGDFLPWGMDVAISNMNDQELAYSSGEKGSLPNLIKPNHHSLSLVLCQKLNTTEFTFSDSGKEQKNLGGQYIYILRERYKTETWFLGCAGKDRTISLS